MSAIRASLGFQRPSPLEVATSWPHGLLAATPRPSAVVRGGSGAGRIAFAAGAPRAALDDALRGALIAAPCFVAFSGGRDSSAVLAAATALARREGHADPIPVTRRYPDLPETDESIWQQLVVDHLGLRTWLQLDFRDGETDLLGATARDGLRRRGLLWPPALQVHSTVYRQLDGGSLLTGEGGDEVLGSRRITPLTLIRKRRPLSGQLARQAAWALAPVALRRWQVRGELQRADLGAWLQPDALRAHRRLVAADEATKPLNYADATWWITRRRTWDLSTRHQALIAAEHGVRASDPLLDPGFVAALAAFGGRWGFAGRTATMKALFADVLPPAVLARTSKAWFNAAYSGEGTRDFAATWDGSGVDHDLVDAAVLRSIWLSQTPTMATALALHSAWLASAEAQRSGGDHRRDPRDPHAGRKP